MTPDPTPNPSDSHINPDNPPTALDKEIQKINQDLLVAKFEAMKATPPGQTTKPQPKASPGVPPPNSFGGAEISNPHSAFRIPQSSTPPQTDNIIDEIMNDIVQRDIALTQQRLARQK